MCVCVCVCLCVCRKKGIFEYSKENLVHEILYHKFAISQIKTGLHLTFSFTSFKMEFNALTIRHVAIILTKIRNNLKPLGTT